MAKAHENIRFHQFHNIGRETIETGVIVEKTVSLTINGNTWLSFMCTPTQLDALAIGFLYNEGIINSPKDISDLRICDNEDNIDIWLVNDVSKPKSWTRTSGCTGGFTSIDFDHDSPVYIKDGFHLSPEDIRDLLRKLLNAQILYRGYGGVHSSALSDGHKIVTLAEDVGRHNTLDKIAGRCVIDGIDLKYPIILTTGRISSEMLQKSARIGAAIVVSRTSPTSMSIRMAKRMGITLIGYARGSRFNVYSHPERIKDVQTTPIS